MANEMSFTGSITVSATNFSERVEPGSILIDVPNRKAVSGVKNVDTTANGTELVATGAGLASGGIYFFRNLDSTDSVEIGQGPSGSFDAMILLKPGEYAIGRLAADMPATTAVFAKAVTNDCDVQFLVFDGS